MNLNELRDRAYKNACKHGFHEKEYSDDHYLMLVICELAEAIEADRKGKRADTSTFTSNMDLYIDLPMNEKTHPGLAEDMFFSYTFGTNIKDSVEDELADTVIRLLDLAGLRGIDLSDIYVWDFVTMKDLSVYIFATIRQLYDTPIERAVVSVISNVFSYCKATNIDLLWHIEMKMKYNECREYMHGKNIDYETDC